MRTIMLRLAAGGPDAVVRRRVSLAEFGRGDDSELSRVLGVLTEARLLTVSEGSIEVAHEALLREWPRIRDWIEEDRAGRRLREHLAAAPGSGTSAGAILPTSTAARAWPRHST